MTCQTESRSSASEPMFTDKTTLIAVKTMVSATKGAASRCEKTRSDLGGKATFSSTVHEPRRGVLGVPSQRSCGVRTPGHSRLSPSQVSPVVMKTSSSPSPLRVSPGFSPGSHTHVWVLLSFLGRIYRYIGVYPIWTASFAAGAGVRLRETLALRYQSVSRAGVVKSLPRVMANLST